MFDYYGSKNALAGAYPAPVHGLIIEPFAGSAAYSMHWLARNTGLRSLLVEKSRRVYEAWMWLKSARESDLDALLDECRLGERTTNFFVMATQASNAFFRCGYMTVNKRMVERLPGSVRRMKQLLPVMERVEIVNGDYSDIQDREATWFIDPPYQPVNGSIRGMGYDMRGGCTSDRLDYRALGEWCRSRSGQVIVCEQEGADWLPFREFRSATNSLDRKYVEMIWNSREEDYIPADDLIDLGGKTVPARQDLLF